MTVIQWEALTSSVMLVHRSVVNAVLVSLHLSVSIHGTEQAQTLE